ncbi:hypothetical protein M501DRAFT_1018263 [Patellaria atrata CBS 101060]|uniref:Uncharacterized protein n=1 Tax=Patellaria atrata CBS 101060 TaxID=1346257 RepID=A0A9P4S785_9PEZI|nr:hypothetical protein M501DRAFT_1018263 [Patellaria atrata CBS 101060]
MASAYFISYIITILYNVLIWLPIEKIKFDICDPPSGTPPPPPPPPSPPPQLPFLSSPDPIPPPGAVEPILSPASGPLPPPPPPPPTYRPGVFENPRMAPPPPTSAPTPTPTSPLPRPQSREALESALRRALAGISNVGREAEMARRTYEETIEMQRWEIRRLWVEIRYWREVMRNLVDNEGEAIDL